MTAAACETAVGTGGSEIEGFAAYVKIKGAKSVLATLWKVDDEGTRKFMESFYGGHQRGLTKGAALAEAQRSMMNGRGAFASRERRGPERVAQPGDGQKAFQPDPGKPFEHPYYWAGFVLFGNWR